MSEGAETGSQVRSTLDEVRDHPFTYESIRLAILPARLGAEWCQWSSGSALTIAAPS